MREQRGEKWQLSNRAFSEKWSWRVRIVCQCWLKAPPSSVCAGKDCTKKCCFHPSSPQYSPLLCHINLSSCSMTSFTQPNLLCRLSLGPNTCSYQDSSFITAAFLQQDKWDLRVSGCYKDFILTGNQSESSVGLFVLLISDELCHNEVLWFNSW